MPPPTPREPARSLLGDLVVLDLDDGYAAAARRREASAGGSARPPLEPPESARPRGARRGGPAVLMLLLAAGVLLAAASGETRRSAPAVAETRDRLTAEVTRRTTATDALLRELATLRREVTTSRNAGLRQSEVGATLADQVATLEAATGAVPVSGPGLGVSVDDAPPPTPDPVTGALPVDPALSDEARVRDRDLQDLVNALWAAGAEAISVDGLRLTARTAIRSAGDAVLVDFRPLSPPYELAAVGDPAILEPAFSEDPAVLRFRTVASVYGLRLSVDRSRELVLPAAGDLALRSVRLPAAPDETAGPAPEPSPGGTP